MKHFERHTKNFFLEKDNVLPTHDLPTSIRCVLLLPAKEHMGSCCPCLVGIKVAALAESVKLVQLLLDHLCQCNAKFCHVVIAVRG